MALSLRSETQPVLSRLVSVSICLCTLANVSLPQISALTWAESAEGKCPCQNDGESSEEGVVVRSSARRRLNNRRHSDLSQPHETGDRVHQLGSYAGRLPAKVGHQLANGLGAPLLI